MTEIKPIRIFIASSAELTEERQKCILVLDQLNNAHKHLALRSVEWENCIPHSNYPWHKNIQDAINQKLKESQLVVFIFHSRIGRYTREEFVFATGEKKKLTAFFKAGFSPLDDQSFGQYCELIQFKKNLNSSVLHEDYKDLNEFEKKLYINLNGVPYNNLGAAYNKKEEHNKAIQYMIKRSPFSRRSSPPIIRIFKRP